MAEIFEIEEAPSHSSSGADKNTAEKAEKP
jgi:hypothetical protein